MARPRRTDRTSIKEVIVTVRLPAELCAHLHELVRRRRIEDPSASAASVVRELVQREALSRGLITSNISTVDHVVTTPLADGHEDDRMTLPPTNGLDSPPSGCSPAEWAEAMAAFGSKPK